MPSTINTSQSSERTHFVVYQKMTHRMKRARGLPAKQGFVWLSGKLCSQLLEGKRHHHLTILGENGIGHHHVYHYQYRIFPHTV